MAVQDFARPPQQLTLRDAGRRTSGLLEQVKQLKQQAEVDPESRSFNALGGYLARNANATSTKYSGAQAMSLAGLQHAQNR